MTQTWANADKLTRDCVADSDKDPLKICKITPGGLEHVHETVDIKILHPKNKPKQQKKSEKIISSFLNTHSYHFPCFYISKHNKLSVMECGISHWTELMLQAVPLHTRLKGTSRAQLLLLHLQNSILELFSAAYSGSAFRTYKNCSQKS